MVTELAATSEALAGASTDVCQSAETSAGRESCARVTDAETGPLRGSGMSQGPLVLCVQHARLFYGATSSCSSRCTEVASSVFELRSYFLSVTDDTERTWFSLH